MTKKCIELMQALQITSHPQNSFCSFTSAKISEWHSTTVHDFGVWILPEQRSTFRIMLTWHCDRVCFIHFSTSELSFNTNLMHLGFPNLLLAHVNLQAFIHSYEHKRKLLCSLCSFYFEEQRNSVNSVEMSKFLTIWWATTSWALQITFIL